MHELAIAESVVSTVLERTGARVSIVRLRVGRLSGVVPDALMGMLALVDVLGAERPVNLGMLEDMAVEPGEWVLIHMGFVVERVDESAAEKAMTGLEMMGRARDDDDLPEVWHG